MAELQLPAKPNRDPYRGWGWADVFGFQGQLAGQKAMDLTTGAIADRILTEETTDQLLGNGNPVLAALVGDVGKYIPDEASRRSFEHGATLAAYLFKTATPDRGIPQLDPIHGYDAALQYVQAFPETPDARALLETLGSDMLATQLPTLGRAFDIAVRKMPEGTDEFYARAGAGVIVLGAMAAMQSPQPDDGIATYTAQW